MSEQVTRCPVAHTNSESTNGRMSRYGLVTAAAQRHIDEPGNHNEINTDLKNVLSGHFDLMSQKRPEAAEQKVARGVRSATFAAFFHIAAEPLAQAAEVPVENNTSSPPFSHTELTTDPTRQFVERVSDSMLNRFRTTTKNMLDPEDPLSVYRGLATALPEVLTDFNRLTSPTELHPSYRTDLSKWFVLAAEDNAVSELDILISAGTARKQQYPNADAEDMMTYAQSHVGTLTQAASVNAHTSAAMSIRNEDPAPGFDFGRKETVVAYEIAVAERRPVAISSGVLHATPEPTWGGSLKNGPWREPGYCAAYPELKSHLVPDLKFRTIDAELTAAIVVAKDTIYSQWPR